MKKIFVLFISLTALLSCSSRAAKQSADAEQNVEQQENIEVLTFNQDSAYSYLEKQVSFGPRVPNTAAHKQAGNWLSAELKRQGAAVTEQPLNLTAFDGTKLQGMNILGRFSTGNSPRILFVAHWDTRPWADKDPDPANHESPNDGANDGASGVAVLLEMARLFKQLPESPEVDILFVDAEDWGHSDIDSSWALGADYFAKNPAIKDYQPQNVIVVDMVGGKGATFRREYFSQQSNPALADAIWQTAQRSGYGQYFPNELGGAVTDDHIQFIRQGIPSIDIIDFDPEGDGFNPTWHTKNDNLQNIDPASLKAVGQTLINYITLK